MSQAPPPPRRRRDSLFRYPHSVEIVALGLRRTTSSEMLPIESSGDDDSDSGRSDVFSPSPGQPPKAKSENGAFLFGSFQHDDVFEPSSPPGGALLSGFEDQFPKTPTNNWPKTPERTSRELIVATTPVDPQVKYSVHFTIFVANLAAHYDDAALQEELMRVFRQYGLCWVKLKRDNRNMPYAFITYTAEEHALQAVEKGRGTEIFGRRCRIEMCNGSVHFIVFKKSGERTTTKEAHQLLEPYGAIAKIEDVSPTILRQLSVPQAKLVSYERYDQNRDVIKAIGPQSPFVVKQYDPKTASDGSVVLQQNRASTGQSTDDRSTIWIGNLPPFLDEVQVAGLVCPFGAIKQVQIREAKSSTGKFLARYCFVVYERPESVDDAVAHLNGKIVGLPEYGQYKIKVQRKRGRAPATPYRAPITSSYPSSFGSQSYGYPMSSTSHASSMGRSSLASPSSAATSNAFVRGTPYRGAYVPHAPPGHGAYGRPQHNRFPSHGGHAQTHVPAPPRTSRVVPLSVVAEQQRHYTLPSVPQPERVVIAESPAAHVRAARASSSVVRSTMPASSQDAAAHTSIQQKSPTAGQDAATHTPIQQESPVAAQNVIPLTSESTSSRVEETSSNPETSEPASTISDSADGVHTPPRLPHQGNALRPYRRAGRYATAPISSTTVAQRAADRAAARYGLEPLAHSVEEAVTEKGQTTEAPADEVMVKSDQEPVTPQTEAQEEATAETAVRDVEGPITQSDASTSNVAQTPVFVPTGLPMPVPMSMNMNMGYMGYPAPYPPIQHIQGYNGAPHQVLPPGFGYAHGRFGKWVCDMMGTQLFVPVEHLPFEQQPFMLPQMAPMPVHQVINPPPHASDAPPSRKAEDNNDEN